MEGIIQNIITTAWDVIVAIWSWITNNAAALGDICLFIVTLYTFRLTVFPIKPQVVGFRRFCEEFESDYIEIVLLNRSLSPLVIRGVEIISDNERIPVFSSVKCDDIVIEGFKTGVVRSQPFSRMDGEKGELRLPFLSDEKIVLYTPKAIHIITRKKKAHKYFFGKRKRIQKLNLAQTMSYTYYGKTIKLHTKYAIHIENEIGDRHIVFVSETGRMSEFLFGSNQLPQELIQDESALKKHFEELFRDTNRNYSIEPLWFR